MHKLEVHAEADEVFVQFDNVIRTDRPRERRHRRRRVIPATIAVIAWRRAEVDKKVFDLCGPVVGERPFQSGTRGPADLKIGLPRLSVQPDLHIRAGNAGGAIKQKPIPGIAGARARFRSKCCRSCSSIRPGLIRQWAKRKMLVQNELLLLPWRPCQSKSPSTPSTKAFH